MDKGMATNRKGLRLMIIGVLVMIAGYILMIGGGSDDPQVFNYAMFDFRRLTAAPIVIICGVVIVVVAIMNVVRKDKEEGK
ncbi:MAG: DUF3098 domain-containing protein [Bacteroidales bacterium]|jgi:hypothetical protein|nr:DUF3098 domain-containing protein [Bacteroidales bacterium]MBQ5943573.1 DUF3098 domain-containing protein [Bacteroidales bacterium]